jgi:flagellar biosynthesis protein FlhA
VRQRLGRSLVQPLLSENKKLKVVTLDPAIEQELQHTFEPQTSAARPTGTAITSLKRILEGIQKTIGDRAMQNSMTLLCSSPARFHLRRLLEPFLPRVVVLAPSEIPATVTIQSLGVVR